MSDFISDITRTKNATDEFIDTFLYNKTEAADKISASYGDLWRAISKVISSGGKRVRPHITSLTYESYGGNRTDAVLQAGVATELLHCAMLIHDDIIDRDIIRYGIKNVSGQYLDKYSGMLSDSSELSHFSNSAALLAGDLLISEAYRIIGQLTDIDDQTKTLIADRFSWSIFAVCGGELLDTEATFDTNPASPMTIATYKTASSSFVGPMLIGATLAKADKIELEKLEKIAESMGIIFQLRDDMLGVFGDSQKTGKTTVGDIREGKKTLLVEEFRRLATDKQSAEFDKIFGAHDLEDEDYHHAAELLKSSGAKSACDEKISQLSQSCQILIDQLNIGENYKRRYGQLLHFIETREK